MASLYGSRPQRFGPPSRTSSLGRSFIASALAGPSPLSSGTYPRRPVPAPLKPTTTVTPRSTPAQGRGPTVARPPVEQPQAPQPTPYDINTDPILAEVTSFLGQSDEQ